MILSLYTLNATTASAVFTKIGGVLLAVLVLLAMVTIHEFGHYIAGKLLGFKINEFSVGFGPAIFQRRSKKTGELFALRIVPLGGYCAFDGEDEEGEEEAAQKAADIAQKSEEEPFAELALPSEALSEENPSTALERANESGKQEEYPEPKGKMFNDQPPWKRIIVLIAGAAMNYLLALVLLIIMTASYGVPMCIAIPVDYTGEQLAPVAWETEELSVCDVILELNGKEIGMYSDCMDALKGKKQGEEVRAKVYRKTEDGWKKKQVGFTLKADAAFKNSAQIEKLEEVMGLSIGTQAMKKGFFGTLGGALGYSGDMATSVLRTLGELITGAFGKDTANVVGGPVSTIGQMSSLAVASPFTFLYISAFIGVNLAVFNLLPVPALDGCRVIFCLIEWIRKKPVNRKVEGIINFVGIVFLFAFAILIDLLKLF